MSEVSVIRLYKNPAVVDSVMAGEGDTLPCVMKAVRLHKFGGPDVLQLDTDVPLPACGAKEVLIKVHAVGVNPVETYMRSGMFGIPAERLPFTPGIDCAGVVVHIGADVTKLKVGDRVYTVQTVSGSYAEFTVAKECHTFKLPDGLTFAEGAALGAAYFTAYRALILDGKGRAAETVLVHGASGGVGMACCQIALGRGMRVLATAGSDRGLQMLRKLNVTAAFNHNKKGYIRDIEEAAGEHGVDIVCEMLANKNLANDVSLLASHGRIMVIGSRGQATFSPSDLFRTQARIHGMSVLRSTEEEYAQMAAMLDEDVAAGSLQPVIAAEFPLSSAAEAHRDVIDHKQGSCGKIILTV